MRKTLFIFIFLLAVVPIYPNGGPVTIISPTRGTGNPVFRNMPDVNLISEKLYIRLDHGYAHIRVKYVLWNNSDTGHNNLDYGFPVDYYSDTRWGDQIVSNIHFRLDKKELQYTHSADIKVQSNESIFNRRWYYTRLSIPRHSFMTLEVEYTVQSGYMPDGASPLLVDLEEEWGTLLYDFSPAGNWGDGIVRDFYVQVDVSAIESSGYFLSSEEDFMGGGEDLSQYGFLIRAGFEKYGDFFTYRARNQDLSKLKPLEINYRYKPQLQRLLQNIVNKAGYTVTASSETSAYPVNNLTDMNLETAWVAKKNGGVGEWIEIHMKEDYAILGGILLVNGYAKSEKTYQENNRIKKLRIEWKSRQQDTITGMDVDLSETDSKDRYYELSFDNLVRYCSWIDFYELNQTPESDSVEKNVVEKIRITILEVYPGSKYNETCVSELLLLKT